MNSRNQIFRFCCAICLCLLGLIEFCDAQTITIDSVAKISFARRGSVLNGGYQRYEIEQEGNIWKCYQAERHEETRYGALIDLKKTFIENVDVADLKKLLNIITKVDTGLNVKMFNMNESVLVYDVDSLYPELKPIQRREVLKSIQSKEIVSKSVYHMLHDEVISGDFSQYTIVVTAKSGCTITADAHSYFLYDFPWNIDGFKNYNPDLAIIFNKMFNDPGYVNTESRRLHVAIIKHIYKNYFEVRFNFENLKLEYPTAYKILRKTFVPIGFYPLNKNGYVSGLFKSKLLPHNVRLNTPLYLDDTLQLNDTKRFEDTVVQLLKKNNFLFEYMKSRAKGTMDFTPGDGLKKTAYTDIKEIFPGIVKYDYGRIKQIEISGSSDIHSNWLLLPDNTLILYRFAGSAQPDKKHIKLMNISSAIINRAYGQGLYNSCILFDASGKVIHDYGVPKGEIIH